MKNIIKLLSLMLAFVLLLGVAGCTDKTDTASKKPSKDKTSSLVSDGSSSETVLRTIYHPKKQPHRTIPFLQNQMYRIITMSLQARIKHRPIPRAKCLPLSARA